MHRDRPSQQALRNQVRCSQLISTTLSATSDFLLDRSSRSHVPLEVDGADPHLGHGMHNFCFWRL